MSPAHLAILMHYYTNPKAHPDAELSWVKELLADWVKKGILDKTTDAAGHTTTDKGNAWCHFICETPMPEQIWIDPRNREPR